MQARPSEPSRWDLPLQVSLGEGEDVYGCRYVHSDFDPSVDAITHFDGAIRAYRSDAFEARRATQMNRAGKHAEYTKIFRIDGPLEVSDWQSLCGSYFRGNPLLAEYFGTEPTVQAEPRALHLSEPASYLRSPCSFSLRTLRVG